MSARERKKREPREEPERTIVGVDGEGMDTPDGRHIYTYLAAVNEHGTLVSEAYNAEGLTHEQCAAMLLEIPKNTLKFGFMFSYDVTKIIEDMPLADRYYLMRPDAREGKACRACKFKWKGAHHGIESRVCEACGGGERRDLASCEPCGGVGSIPLTGKECPQCGAESVQSYTQNLRWKGRAYGFFNGSLSIANDHGKKGARSTKVWDCFRFFGCAFVEAIKDWGIGTPEEIAEIKKMKDKRGDFDTEGAEEVNAYCRHECHLLAKTMRKVVDAHDAAGISLKRFEGAGSTATALLKKFDVGEYKGPHLRALPGGLAYAISCAFFGGRFENSRIGRINAAVQSYDISSAYPYALADLPCLKCGEWSLARREMFASDKAFLAAIKKADLALVKFQVGKLSAKERNAMAWGPLPCRDEKGSICYGTNFTGWAWRPEFLSALAWPHVSADGEAWLYKTPCKHKPFSFLPEVYRQRVAWGKEGAGKALKLGSNASYGKTAQTLGEDPPFQSWVWAGMTTSTCRAQLLDGIKLAKDPWSVLAVATDGIYATETLAMPAPRNTGTGDLAKPLGGWEHKEIPEGAFLAKPGLYFRLAATFADVRARGVGRREVYEQRERLMQAFAEWDRKDFDYHVKMQSRRFYGAKTSVLAQSRCEPCGKSWPGVPEKGCPVCKKIGLTFKVAQMKTPEGKDAYGTWNLREVRVKFDPHPKRERRLSRGGSSVRLHMRDLGGITSAAYKTGVTTPEGDAARAGVEFALEQPDWEGSTTDDL